jgi:hypothetical protein
VEMLAVTGGTERWIEGILKLRPIMERRPTGERLRCPYNHRLRIGYSWNVRPLSQGIFVIDLGNE